MRIYVDFDDCLCETGRAFSKLVLEMFNKHVPYDQMHYFELDRSFDLDAEQYELKVLVFDRPWNRECVFPNGNYQRCADWESIRKIVTGE